MNTVEESEEVRKRMESYSAMVNNALGQSQNRVGIKYSIESGVCPRCGSGLKCKSGIVKGRQRWRCLVCWKHYFEDHKQ